MKHQLKSMTMLELELKRELSTLGQVINIELLDQWEVKVKEHPHDIQTEKDALNNAAPLYFEGQHEIFVLKKGILEDDSNKGRRYQTCGTNLVGRNLYP